MSEETKGWLMFVAYLCFVAGSVAVLAYLSMIAPEPLPALPYAP